MHITNTCYEEIQMTNRMTIAALSLAVFAGSALANPVDGFYSDLPGCDNHGLLQAREELGTGAAFPVDELISAVATFTNITACPTSDDPGMPNVLVVMTNLSGRDWTDLYYVGDPDTTFSNVDGIGVSAAAPGVSGLAVRLDMLGVNRSLLAESGAVDGVFSAGETWEFILQDWSNPFGLGPDMMGSLDFAGASAFDFASTGSIVQFVPAPGTSALLGLGGLVSLRRRRTATG